jgi:hypothetical protein
MGVDPAELADQGLPGNLRECARQLDAGGTSANDAEGQPDFAPFRVRFFFGGLECKQLAPADFERILQGFEARGMLFPLVMAKVTVRGASAHDEVIEHQRGSIGKQDPLARCVNLDNLGK